MTFRNFYFDSYNDTKWIPMYPFDTRIELGDVFQINQGRVRRLLNTCVDLELVNPIEAYDYAPIQMDDWRTSRGCIKVSDMQTVETLIDEQRTRRQQAFRFENRGDYLFHGDVALATFMSNWSKVSPELTVKLTQSKFTFRDVYVITAVAVVERWGLAVAAQEGAELTLTGEQDNSAYLLAQKQCQLTSNHDLAFFAHQNDVPMHFFKAKKLTLSEQMYDEYLARLHCSSERSPRLPLDNWLHANLLNLSATEQLNINTCQEFFQWQDANLDDVLRLSENH
ncbi:hypothetical protein [Pseudoalteromonas sp. R3]|uniref:hypothetical protein n=1 Tax=Pseudoalteromonas sp. R3 TaxID=1709477 RepID=UPI0006B5D058|nr:hypothetical protein [Pseudoalteromonas sp. R3]AZZ98475.1 hypothetical protein ELR70_15960 [Pseudoalteromonas sp. R3]